MVDDLEIIRILTGQYPDINKLITSPFRSDRNPGARFKYYNGKLRFYDSGDSQRHGKSALQLYMIEKNLSFEDALIELRALEKPTVTKRIIPKKVSVESNTIITTHKMKWSLEGKKFWSDLGVTDLSGMYQNKGVTVSSETSVCYLDKSDELCFTYLYDAGQFKVYTPFPKNPKDKWLGNAQKYNCQWYECDSDTLLTLKCDKCYRVVLSIVKEEKWKINLNHLQGENIGKTKANIPNYSIIKKYKRHIIIFDPDDIGKASAEVCREHLNSETPFVEVAKDISAMYLLMGREFTKEWLRSIIFKGTA